MQQELDPLGKSQHELGAKLDAGKQLPGLVLGDFGPALKEVVKVGTYGANKYTAHGWLHVPDGYHRYKEAFMRHWLEVGSGLDPESNIHHLSHAAWNILAMLTLAARSNGTVVIPSEPRRRKNKVGAVIPAVRDGQGNLVPVNAPE